MRLIKNGWAHVGSAGDAGDSGVEIWVDALRAIGVIDAREIKMSREPIGSRTNPGLNEPAFPGRRSTQIPAETWGGGGKSDCNICTRICPVDVSSSNLDLRDSGQTASTLLDSTHWPF